MSSCTKPANTRASGVSFGKPYSDAAQNDSRSDSRSDIALCIGRFQPFHAGHKAMIEHAATLARTVVILVGSAYRPRSWKNPFTYGERRRFIEASLGDLRARTIVMPLIDTLYNDRAWSANVRTAVRVAARRSGLTGTRSDVHSDASSDAPSVVLVGFEKDDSSAYLRWFPEWTQVNVEPTLIDGKPLNATDLRQSLFFDIEDASVNYGEPHDAYGVEEIEIVQDWMMRNKTAVAQITKEAAFVKSYRQRIAEGEKAFGYPIAINTVDAVIIQSGHVLMVERGQAPGKGLLALPGGHIDRDETAIEACLREVYEECRLNMPRGALRSRMKRSKVFDHPKRSERGWVRTEAFLFELEARTKLETVRGGDDAARAVWVPLADINPSEIFEDHFDILQDLVPDIPFAYASLLLGLE